MRKVVQDEEKTANILLMICLVAIPCHSTPCQATPCQVTPCQVACLSRCLLVSYLVLKLPACDGKLVPLSVFYPQLPPGSQRRQSLGSRSVCFSVMLTMSLIILLFIVYFALALVVSSHQDRTLYVFL